MWSWLWMGAAVAAEPVVCFQPLGRHEPYLVQAAARGVRVVYGFPVQLLPATDFPTSAWTPARKRWRADHLLDWLAQTRPEACSMVVGLTSEDISTTKGPHDDWGVFGLAQIKGRSAMVSSFRLREGARPQQSRLRRVVKITNHEVGHVLGLRHGGALGCLMNDALGRVQTVDRMSGLLCELPRLQIRDWWQVTLPELDSFPWDEFPTR